MADFAGAAGLPLNQLLGLILERLAGLRAECVELQSHVWGAGVPGPQVRQLPVGLGLAHAFVDPDLGPVEAGGWGDVGLCGLPW